MTSTEIKSDAQIQEDVTTELAWDPRVEEADIGVAVDAGVVTLTGIVRSHTIRAAAQEAAHRVRGVLVVVNDIAVRPTGNPIHTDCDLARAIGRTMQANPAVPPGS